jgi:4-hydroxybenzoate polyprenyltransferase
MFGGFVSFARSVKTYGRLTAAGLGLSCVVTGQASALGPFDLRTVGFLLLVGLAFHIVAFAVNDLFDLEIDRTDPTRAGSPLVLGDIRPRTSAVLLLAIGVGSFGIDRAAFGPSARAVSALAAAYVFLLAYDAFGKRVRWPVVTDAMQGIGWACLVWYGAERGGGPTSATWLTAAFTFLFVVMVNGVHGGLRDLANDSTRGARTTAIAFGAISTSDRLVVPLLLTTYSWVLQAALAVIAAAAILTDGVGAGRLLWYLAGLTCTIVAITLHWAGFQSAGDAARFKNIGAAHILACYLPLTMMTAMFGGWRFGVTTVAAMFLPMLGNESFRASFASMPALALSWFRPRRDRPAATIGPRSDRDTIGTTTPSVWPRADIPETAHERS